VTGFHIGRHRIAGRVLLAPMAGVTDAPFRSVCASLGAALTCGEMLSADQGLWHTRKSRLRGAATATAAATVAGTGRRLPLAVQLAGADPAQLAEAARAQVDAGADIIDLNLGCPAKKVCNRMCGSALLGDEDLVARIFDTVVRAVPVPVTAKIRTGPDPTRRNATRIAQLAEACGIAALAVHGRTRADRFAGSAEYSTIRAVCEAVRIPVIANGDITTPQQAADVLESTGAAAVMIGRAALGSPWIFAAVNRYIDNAHFSSDLLRRTRGEIILGHLESLYEFHGEYHGVRLARKHLARYCDLQEQARAMRGALLAAEDSASQRGLAQRAFADGMVVECAAIQQQ
jgi:tRNA-dihydrouridine synthase B